MKVTLVLNTGAKVDIEHPDGQIVTLITNSVLNGETKTLVALDNLGFAKEFSNVKAPKIPTAKKGAHHKVRHQQAWSDRDIVGVGKIIRDNIDLNSGITTLVRKFIRNDADVKDRTEATLASCTSDIKLYLKTGDKKRANGKVRSVLDAHGIFPVVRSNYLNIDEA